MKATIKCYSLIKYYEGVRFKPYVCPSGKLTIGYGHTRNVHENMRINDEIALMLLAEDVSLCEDVLNRHLPDKLLQHQFDAMCSFIFNIGETKFLKSTLYKYLQSKYYNLASVQILKWKFGRDHEGRLIELPGLVKRRKSEKELFENNALIFYD